MFLNLLRWTRVAVGVAWAGLLLGASGVHAEGLVFSSTLEVGVNAWAITPREPDKPSAPSGLNGSAYNDHVNLFLPDSETRWNFRPVSPWARFTTRTLLSPEMEFNLKARADQWMGTRLDVAHLDWAPSPFVGLRTGVVSFNTQWCRTYDVDSPWIEDPDMACRNQMFMAITNAAPGVQAYVNTLLGDYQLQSIVGVYRPMLFSYETQEFGLNFRNLRSNFKREFNRKTSAALNLVHLQTGSQMRLGWIHSDQAGDYTPQLTPQDRARHNLMEHFYWGVDTYLQPHWRLRYSISKFASRNFYDGVLVVRDHDKSETLELIHELKSTDQLALGWSQLRIASSVDDLAFANYQRDDYYFSNSASVQIAWRHQWGQGLHSALQWTHAWQTNGYEGRRRPSSGDAIGMHWSYQF